MELVDLDRTQSADEIMPALDALAARVKEGEFSTVFFVAIAPDGRWLTKEAGSRRLHALMKIGILESVKSDILKVTEVDDASGL